MVSVPLWQLAFPGNQARAPAGCEAGTSPRKSGTSTKTAPDTAASPGQAGHNAGADVQAPEVLNITAQGLWDGQPSPGDVWVASADARDPKRVIIRNDATGETGIGALFRRERENPGPPIRLPSDAADAPGLLSGQPARVTITALRRSEDTPAAAAPATAVTATGTATTAAGPAKAGKSAKTTPQAEPAAVETGALHTGAVAAAIDKANARTPVMDPDAMAQAAPAASTAAAPAASSPAAGGKSCNQPGIFSVEANARPAADTVTRAGASAAPRKEASKGKPCWSSGADPAASAANRDALMKKIKGLGSADACFVSR
jgi:hypothetical protein